MEPSNRDKSLEIALSRALEELKGVDMVIRSRHLGLRFYQDRNSLLVGAFESDAEVFLPGFEAVSVSTGEKLAPLDRILVLRYLIGGMNYDPSEELISFQELPGGMFYLEPFCGRTTIPLVHRFGNDIDLLVKRLEKFSWRAVPFGDVGASIQAVEKVRLTLVYRAGDPEFPPSAEILFDSGIKKIYSTDEVAALSARICRTLAKP